MNYFKFFRLTALAIWTLSIIGPSRLLAVEDLILKAGAVAIDITPEKLPVETAGGMVPYSTSKVHDKLMARVLVLDNGQTKIAMVVCDSCMIPREIFDAAKEKAAQLTGIPATNILCSATHSHSAVCVARVFQSTVDQTYVELLKSRIIEGITKAHKQLEPARIGWAIGNNPAQVFNRRWFLRPGTKIEDPFDLGTDKVRMNPAANQPSLLRPAGPTDPAVPVLSVQTKDGSRLIAIWANYSLHYVGGIPEGGLSGDYFGEFSRQLVQLLKADNNDPPTVAAMTNGTSGDINNVNFFEGPPPGRKPFEQIQFVAGELAKTSANAYGRVEYLDWVPLIVKQQELQLGVRKPNAEEIVRAKDILAAAGPPPWKDRRQIYANETLHMAEYPDQVSAVLQVLRIGDVGIATTPCETFVETGLAIKEESPLTTTFVVELANGYNGYLPTPEQHALGGYETWRAKSSYLTVDSEPKVRQALLGMLNQVAKAEKLIESTSSSAVGSSATTNVATAKTLDQKKTSAAIVTGSDALRSIESTRGGRHWADAATDPPKSPEASLACIQVEPGFRVELVAAEPLVVDPVWLAFDEYGHLFVAEYSDYPTGPAEVGAPPLSKIVMLEDTDHDGRMDRRHVFADKLDFAHSFMPYRDGLLVGSKTEVLYLRDTDGDHRADIREVLFRGFKPAHPQMQIGCPVWGFDNWIYLTYGPGEIERPKSSLASAAPEKLLNRRDFRLHPLNLKFEKSSGLGQFGHTVDSVGNRFFCTNRNPIIAAPISPTEFERNPHVLFSGDQYDVAPSGGDSLVFPLVEMKSNYLSHAGTHTAACGTTAYTGDLFGTAFSSSVFVCEPIGNLVTRSIVTENGATLKATRARPKADFLASTDTWFRPSSLANGPDGALYIADMYRLWVEHPKFLPPDIAAKLDWRAGDDRGRIWRVVPESAPRQLPAFKRPATTNEVVQLLAHSNGWQRELAQRLIVERQTVQAEPEIRKLLTSSNNQAHQRALWTLHGLGLLTSSDLLHSIDSTDVHVRRDSVRLAEQFLSDLSLLDRVIAASADPDARVRMQSALTLGSWRHAATSPALQSQLQTKISAALAALASLDQDQSWTASAILTSTRGLNAQTHSALVDLARSGNLRSTPVILRLFRDLASAVGATGELNELRLLLKVIGSGRDSDRWWQYVSLSGLASGLGRQDGSQYPKSLTSLLAKPPSDLATEMHQIDRLLKNATEVAIDNDANEVDRLSAIEILGHLPKNQWDAVALQLFKADQPVSVQLSVLQQMRRLGGVDGAQLIFEQWPQLGPQVRTDSIGLLLQRKETTKLALQAMLSGRLDPSAINIDQRATLLSHPDPEIKQLATGTFGSGISPDRQQVSKLYSQALTLRGDAAAGQQVFGRICAACHRFNGQGQEVGPDISDTRNRSREALLYDILDPNQKLEPKYTAYQVLTADGSVFQGLLAAESAEAVTLKLAEGKQQTIARADIEQLRASGKSLMPEGVEKDVSVQQMADLLEFLKH